MTENAQGDAQGASVLERYLGAIPSHAKIAAFLIDEDAVIVEANAVAATWVAATSPEVLVGLKIDAKGITKAMVADLNLSGEPLADPAGKGAFAGQARGLQWRASLIPLSAAAGEAGSAIVLVTKSSVSEASENSALRAEKLAGLRSIVAGISHELNNPLTAILGYSELLLAKSTDGQVRSRLAKITQEAERSRNIIKSLLSFSRRHKAQFVETDINELIHEIVSLPAYQMRVDNIEIVFDLDSSIPEILAQPDELMRAFLNITHNAHQALTTSERQDRKFMVRSRLRDETIEIEFMDNGSGIPPEIRDKIFDPFFTTHSIGEGMGLGLSVVYGVIQDHNGDVRLSSEVGRGTTMTVEFPLKRVPKS